ncbi:MAG: rhomboid family intramembrane serine protease [Chitinivibrionia bacterium]|nr:rhomboid family intramembrane serine protease [Chitinivibrionia bacterium]
MPQYYYFERRPVWGGFSTGSMVTKIVLANVIVYILQQIFSAQFTRLFALTPRMLVERYYVWQIFSYMFLHFGFWHLLFNMFIVWMFGSPLEAMWGKRRFLEYYLACGIGGAVFSIFFTYNHITLGASAAGFGLLLAYAMLFPDNYIYIWFLFPVKAKHLVLFIAVLQLLQGISGPTGIAYFAHLGGMAAGLLFFRKEMSCWRIFSRSGSAWRIRTGTRESEREDRERRKVDSILDAIASKGYDNLSATEKRILEHYSRTHKEDSD